jgi:hypothetical protein
LPDLEASFNLTPRLLVRNRAGTIYPMNDRDDLRMKAETRSPAESMQDQLAEKKTRLVTDDGMPDEQAAESSENAGSINSAYWDNIPVVKNSPVQKNASQPDFVSFGKNEDKPQPAAPKKGKTARLLAFGAAATCASLAVQLWFIMQPIPNSNNLAVGTHAKAHGPTALPFDPPCELDNLSKGNILALRTDYVNKHPELLAAAYTPYHCVWKDIADNRPWWGIKGYYWNDSGENNQEGPSLVGPMVANPFLLTGVEFTKPRKWHHRKAHPNDPKFEFTCEPSDLTWNADESKMEVTYDLTGFYKRYREAGGASQFHVISAAMIHDYNAFDFGYTYKHLRNLTNGEPLTPGVVGINQFLHAGQTMGIPCNNSGTVIKSDWDTLQLKPGSDIEVHLWKKRPPSPESKPDFTCIWHIR